jgi:hypothetical protein
MQDAVLIEVAHSLQSDWPYIRSPSATPPPIRQPIRQ